MTITYQLERWEDLWKEFDYVMTTYHAPEVSVFQDKMTVKIDHDHHMRMDEAGVLESLTVRDNGKLIGYHITLVVPNPHFVGVRTAFVVHYFLHPDYRGRHIGSTLFRHAEASLKRRGVQCVQSAAKTSLPYAQLYRHLGWSETETLFMKWLGD